MKTIVNNKITFRTIPVQSTQFHLHKTDNELGTFQNESFSLR